jgi:type VI protein secretion system component VasK
MRLGVLVAAIVLWVVPTFAAHGLGKPRRRWGALYGLFLGWLGVIIVALLPALPELSTAEQLARLERRRGQLRPDYVAREQARLRAELATATRECPFCKEAMRRDASVCRHCRHDSDAWIYEDGRWRARSGDAWFALVEASGEWEPLGAA